MRKRLRASFFAAYPTLRRYQNGVGATEQYPITTKTLYGRCVQQVTRYQDKLNFPSQGSGADMLKLAMVRLWEARLMIAAHDELVLEAPRASAEQVKVWLTEHMIAAGEQVLEDVPVETEVFDAPCWVKPA
jgi:DNA polymerase I-like protein with 3'-5' exonuclease and polymerase domains